RLGSIEIGKDADFAIFNGHPLNGYSRCEMAIIDGKVFFQRSEKLTPFEPAKAGPAKPVAAMAPIAVHPDKKYVIRGATIHPVVGPTQAERDVLIENGKIKSLASDTPTEATAIVANGLHLYP